MKKKFRNEDFILNKTDNTIVLCPNGKAPISSEYNYNKKHYLVKLRADTCKKCEFLSLCPIKIKGAFSIIKIADKTKGKNISIDPESSMDYIKSLQLDDSYKKSFDEEIELAIGMGVVFSSYEADNLSMSIDDIYSDQRNVVLDLLKQLCNLTNISFRLNHIIKGTKICIHNLNVILNERTFVKKSSYLNNIEKKLLSIVINNIKNIIKNIENSNDTKYKVYSILEIRKIITMVQSVIKNEALPHETDKILIESFVDEFYETFFVNIKDEEDFSDDITFTWNFFKRDDIPEITHRLQNVNYNWLNEKYDEITTQYYDYFEQASKYIKEENFDKAQELLNKIVSHNQIFEFTSGAYVNLASIEFNKNLYIISDEWKEKVEELLNKAIEVKSSNIYAPVYFVLLYIYWGDFDKSIKWLDKCNNENSLRALEDQLQFHLNNLNFLMFTDNEFNDKLNSEEAYIFFNKLLEIYPDIRENVIIQCLIAKLYILRDNTGIIKAYDIYKSIINKNPNSFLGYLYLAELCGEGYLNRPYEQEEYCKKAMKLLEKADTIPDNNLEKYKFVAQTNLTGALISQKRYNESLEITKNSLIRNPNNTDLHNHAAALYYLGKYDESIKYCQRELYVTEDEVIYQLLAMNYYSLKEYKKASEYYKKALEFIDTGKLSTFYKDENNQPLFSFTKPLWQTNKLKDIFIPLIDCYFRNEDYIKAKAIWLMASDKFPDDKAIFAWENIIDSTLKDKKQIELAENHYITLIEEFESEREKNLKKELKFKQWALDLMKLQGMDEFSEVSDSDWEYFEKNIDNILKSMINEVNNPETYNVIKDDFMKKYQNFEPRSIEFLSTAEYLFKFNENNFIDFAPIMIEYCKVVELELRAVLKNSMMLGQNLKYINDFKIKPLYNVYPLLNEIYQYRNGSAHIGVSTRDKVNKVRDLLYNKGVLSTISKMK